VHGDVEGFLVEAGVELFLGPQAEFQGLLLDRFVRLAAIFRCAGTPPMGTSPRGVAMRRVLPVLILALGLAAPAVAQTAEEGYAAYDAGDYAKARTILLPLAEAGDPKAMNRIGFMYDFGKGFPKNPTLGCDWYEKAAMADNRAGLSNISICYELGNGRPKDMEKAIYWARKAAERGDADSQIFLLRHYAETDRKQAQTWGQKAADQGSVVARVLMRGYGMTYSGPQASRFDVFCVLIMNGLLDRPRDTCNPR
jgi:hypothetical protein